MKVLAMSPSGLPECGLVYIIVVARGSIRVNSMALDLRRAASKVMPPFTALQGSSAWLTPRLTGGMWHGAVGWDSGWGM